ncbi:hypothetical protein ACIBEA_21620 [Streptomyces sp. NPDC051555]|uniref:hypothetical protein n=1 Tax=Streptomyces sp. NPDC051555 TaxID=3365657 RepID=UPI0037A7C753
MKKNQSAPKMEMQPLQPRATDSFVLAMDQESQSTGLLEHTENPYQSQDPESSTEELTSWDYAKAIGLGAAIVTGGVFLGGGLYGLARWAGYGAGASGSTAMGDTTGVNAMSATQNTPYFNSTASGYEDGESGHKRRDLSGLGGPVRRLISGGLGSMGDGKRPVLEFTKNAGIPVIGSAPFDPSAKWNSEDKLGATWVSIREGAKLRAGTIGAVAWGVDFTWKIFSMRLRNNNSLRGNALGRKLNEELAGAVEGFANNCKQMIFLKAWDRAERRGASSIRDDQFKKEVNEIVFRCQRKIDRERARQNAVVREQLQNVKWGAAKQFVKKSGEACQSVKDSVRTYANDILEGRTTVTSEHLKPKADFSRPLDKEGFTYARMHAGETVAYNRVSGQVFRHTTAAGAWEELPDLAQYLKNTFKVFGTSSVEGVWPMGEKVIFVLKVTGGGQGDFYAVESIRLTGQKYSKNRRGNGSAQQTFWPEKWEKFSGAKDHIGNAVHIYATPEGLILVHSESSYTLLNDDSAKAEFKATKPPLLAQVKRAVNDRFGSGWTVSDMSGGPSIIRVTVTNGTATQYAEYSVRRDTFRPVQSFS